MTVLNAGQEKVVLGWPLWDLALPLHFRSEIRWEGL